jgi:hypothetical protein
MIGNKSIFSINHLKHKSQDNAVVVDFITVRGGGVIPHFHLMMTIRFSGFFSFHAKEYKPQRTHPAPKAFLTYSTYDSSNFFSSYTGRNFSEELQ